MVGVEWTKEDRRTFFFATAKALWLHRAELFYKYERDRVIVEISRSPAVKVLHTLSTLLARKGAKLRMDTQANGYKADGVVHASVVITPVVVLADGTEYPQLPEVGDATVSESEADTRGPERTAHTRALKRLAETLSLVPLNPMFAVLGDLHAAGKLDGVAWEQYLALLRKAYTSDADVSSFFKEAS